MDDATLARLAELLVGPGRVAPADGLEVIVTSLAVRPASDPRLDDELELRFAVTPLPEGVARQPLPSRYHRDLADYAGEVAEEVQAWAVEHVRRFRPLPPFDREQVASELPPADELWRRLRAEFEDVEDLPHGFVGTTPDGQRVQVLLSSEQWQALVVDAEIGCRRDHGVDADSAGDGPGVALDLLGELLAPDRGRRVPGGA